MTTLKLFQLPALDRVPSFSPFCMKVETFLRMAKLPYETVYIVDPRKAPKGKLPFIEDGPVRLGDSSLILAHLRATRGVALDDWLDPAMRAKGLATQRMLEEHLYWAMVHARWSREASWRRLEPIFLAPLPSALRRPVGAVARRMMNRTMRAHGIGRHSDEEIERLGIADLDALSAILGASPFLLGDRESSFDAVAHAFVANIVDVDMDSGLASHARALKNLVEYGRRMTLRYYPQHLAAG